MRPIYIHKGGIFDKRKFVHIKNRAFSNKPTGGFWASAENAVYGWRDWCRDYNFNNGGSETCRFRLKENCSIFVIDSVKKALTMPDRGDAPGEHMLRCTYPVLPDFEKISTKYDAIDFRISEDTGLYKTLYGWDCDSILVLNPDVIEVIG